MRARRATRVDKTRGGERIAVHPQQGVLPIRRGG